MLRQIYLIIISLGDLPFVREPARTFILVEFRFTNHRHDRKLSVIIDPRTWLVGLFKTTDLVSRIYILPSISHLTSLRSPEIHTPRTSDRRIGISCRQLKSRLCTHQGVHIFYGVKSLIHSRRSRFSNPHQHRR